ncbi:MAG: RsbRD N-terminal domain-containing protein [Desulfobulbaceae bacterium]|nr:RsbRD N-terminal domain-containing protein [Desulfobulbaceae bacterium]
MQISDFLQENGEILDKWHNRVIATYPEGGGAALKKEKDRFANPLGHNIIKALTAVYKHFCDATDLDTAMSAVEELVRIRAVQEFSASDAVSFIYLFKEVIKDENGGKKEATLSLDEWLAFEKRIDAIAFRVFDMYMDSRERIFKVRLQEFKRNNHLLTDNAVCASALMRQNQQEQTKIEPINIHSSHEAR